ncbi:hypothetical protein BKA69DRAFT_1173179 [Paraphysoderma sedebokerense]|nr:hypothetical protein BKA69DRAFT_1173179 [Paraphysoderma sedebokerense]
MHHTTLQFLTSFGLDRKVDSILDSFLRQVYIIFGGDKGYFSEQNRYGQMSIICHFSFEMHESGEIETRIDSADDSTDIPTALLEHGLLLDEPAIANFDNPLDIYREEIGCIDLQTLELLAGQLAAALDDASLFSQLEEANRDLEEKVKQRTAELESNNKLLHNAKQQALQAAEAKAVFLSNMSHEIRTPISQIILAAEMLCDSGIGSEGLENAQVIVNSSKFLLSLVNDILNLSKLESGKVVINHIPFNLFETISITMDAFAVHKDVRVAYYIPSDIPQVVVGDEIRIRQILTNLVSNAIKFTQRGHVLVHMTLIDEKEDTDSYHINFKVIDTGTGIAEGNISKIFQRFEQEKDSTSRTYGGTGLGLSICQNLCTLMGSKIALLSKLDHGSTFEFSIKFEKPPQDTSDKLAVAHVLKANPTILLLEELKSHSSDRSVLALQLETMRAHIDCRAISGPSNFNPYSLVVIDLSTTDQSITEVCSGRSVRSGLPIVVIHTKDQLPAVEKFSRSTKLNLFTLIHPYKQSSLYHLIQNGLSKPTLEAITEAGPKVASDIGNTSIKAKADLKILLAEDNLVNQAVFRTMVTKLGYSIDIADNGRVAVEMCRNKLYDVIFMDIRMPVMDGLEATRHIRRRYGSLDSLNTLTEDDSAEQEELIDSCVIPKLFVPPTIIGLRYDLISHCEKRFF